MKNIALIKSIVATPLNVIVEMYIAGLEAKLQALRALVK